MSQGLDANLMDAVAKGAPVTIGVAWTLGQFQLRSRFVPEAGGLVMERPAGQGGEALFEKLIAGGKPVVMNFRGESNYQFPGVLTVSPVNPKWLVVNAAGPVTEVQRRQTYRVLLGATDSAARAIRASRIPAYAVLRDRASKSQEFELRLLDLSPLGMGLIALPKGNDRIALENNQRLRLVMPGTGGEEILLGGCVKHAAAMPGDRLRIGVEFRQAEYDVKDRQNVALLAPILNQLQRAEARLVRGTEATPAAA